jgi:hypothetical protein
MSWTMPRPVLRWVAAVLGLTWLGAFAFAVATTPERGRLPGDNPRAQVGTPLEAVEATPLSDERIEGSSAPPQLSDEEKARLAEEKEARELAAAAKAQAEQAAAAAAATPPPAIQPPAAITPPPLTPQPRPEDPPF